MTTALLRGCDEFPDLVGRQEPEWSLRSEGVDFLHGVRCLEFFEWSAKMRAFPWQVDEIMQVNACDSAGRWTHSDHAIICARQNGKSLIAEAVILYRLFVLGHKIVFTAQRWPTAQSIRNRLWARIKSNRKLTAQIVRNVNSQGMAEIELESGAKVQFSTRSGDAGRGFDKVDLVIFDESYNLDDADIDALLPIQLKADDPQTMYLSSPVNRETHTFGVKLSELRTKVHTDRPAGWAWSEYAAPEGLDRESEETWALANPSLRSGPEMEAIRKLLGSMSKASFDVEILGRGLWFEDIGEDDASAIDADTWQARKALDAFAAGGSCVAVECEPVSDPAARKSRRWSITAAVRTATGKHLQLGYYGPGTPAQIAARVARLVELNDPVAVVLDDKSIAKDLLAKELVDLEIEPEFVKSTQVSEATNGFLQGVDDGSFTHDGDERVDRALEAAKLRQIGTAGGVAWARVDGVDVSPVIALTNAAWGLDEFDLAPPPPPPSLEHDADAASARTATPDGLSDDVLTVQW